MSRGASVDRVLAIAAALVAAGIHFALGTTDLIPGEPTRGWVFIAMSLGYLACAAGLALHRARVHDLVLLYALGLIAAYAASRTSFPVEAIGLTSKVAESVVVATLLATRLMERATAAGRG